MLFSCRMPGQRGTQSNYSFSFTGEPPFDEHPVGLMRKKVLREEDVEKLAAEMMATQNAKKQTLLTSRSKRHENTDN